MPGSEIAARGPAPDDVAALQALLQRVAEDIRVDEEVDEGLDRPESKERLHDRLLIVLGSGFFSARPALPIQPAMSGPSLRRADSAAAIAIVNRVRALRAEHCLTAP
jgi:hypothetical protein